MTFNSKNILFDQRWLGRHGIGRFAQEIFNRIDGLTPIALAGHPAEPFDCVRLSRYLSGKEDIFFSPGFNSPLFFSGKTIITVHDLNHIDIDDNSSVLKRIYYETVLKKACRNAERILTVSAFSRGRICDWSGVDGEKVVVVGNGVSEDFSPDGDRYLGRGPYIFTVGNRKSHKNECKALEAFALSSLSRTHDYLFTGNTSGELQAKIAEYRLGDRVRFIGQVSDYELACLYRGADILLFPSLYEGFGLPVIEAMACGAAVLTSEGSSLGEIAGDAAHLVDPTSTDEIVYGIEKICSDRDYREALCQRGYRRAGHFSWENTAARVCGVLKAL